MRHRQAINIHSIETKDNVWNRHNDRNDRQDLHDDIQIVRNDTRKGIHRSAQDIGIDITHLNRLMDLDHDVFQKIFIFFIQLDHFSTHDLI